MTVPLKMCLTVTLKKNPFTIQKYKKKKTPTTHSSNKVYVFKDSIKCLKMHFSFYFQYLKCAFERPLVTMYTLKPYYCTK